MKVMSMNKKLLFSAQAEQTLHYLEQNHSDTIVYKAVQKILTYMSEDLHHPSLHTHEYTILTGQNGEKVFEAYVQQHTPGAYRIFWHYGPEHDELTIVAITPHP